MPRGPPADERKGPNMEQTRTVSPDAPPDPLPVAGVLPAAWGAACLTVGRDGGMLGAGPDGAQQ